MGLTDDVTFDETSDVVLFGRMHQLQEFQIFTVQDNEKA